MEELNAPDMPDWLSSRLPFRRYGVNVNGRFMHVMEQGEGGTNARPILLLHGNPTWGYLYRKVAKALKGKGFRLIIPDLIGLGFSDKPQSPEVHTLANHGQWVRSLVEALDLRGLIFVGQDWGGPIGLRALAECQERVAGLVIANTTVGPPRENFKSTTFHKFSQMPLVSDLIFRGLGFPQVSLNMVQGDGEQIKGVDAKAYRFPLKGLRNNVAPLALARMVPDTMEHASVAELRRCLAFVEGFEGPTSLVWGKKDPILGGLLKHTRKVMPNAEVTETGAGHFLQEQVPQELADAIISVARRCGDNVL